MEVQESVIKLELDWLEQKFKQLRQYLDDNPPDKAEDRTETIPSSKGVPIIKVISTKEAQVKSFQSVLQDLIKFFPDLKKLREENQTAQVEMRGGAQLNGMMKKRFGT